MSRHTLLITAAIAAVIVIAAAIAYGVMGAPFSQGPGAAATGGDGLSSAENRDGRDESGVGAAERYSARVKELVDRLRDLQKRPGNFQAFLNQLQQHCSDPAECAALLNDVLAEYPDREFAGMVARLVSRMPGYEQAMQALVMSTAMSPRERYDRLWSLREQMLGREEAAFAFGQEKAYADYQFRYGELVAGAGGLSSEQRLAALEKLRQSAANENADAVRSAEGADGAYERERELLLAGVTDAAEQARITAMLRRRHFGAVTVAQMEARDVQLASQKEAVATYQADVAVLRQELEALRPGMDEASWQRLREQRMTELRLRHFP